MPRRQNPVPIYRLHKPSGQAVVTLRDAAGHRRDIYLGVFDSEDSRAEYRRVLAEWEQSGRQVPGPTHDLTVSELLSSYRVHAENYYRHADGTPTREIENVRLAVRPWRQTFGHTAVVDFGPKRFKALRDDLVKSGLSRGVINQRMGVVKRVVGWAVSEELLPATVAHALREVDGLKRGRTEAREPEPVEPAPAAHLEAALPFMSRQVAAMAQLQALSGARAGEIVVMRTGDLNTSGPTWTYTPAKHKSEYRGLTRTIYLGPRAQEVLRPFLKTDLAAYMFSPREAEAERLARLRAGRTTPLWPSHVKHQRRKRAKGRKHPPGDKYLVRSYWRAIMRACKAAGVPAFGTHRLRHSFGTTARTQFDLDAARAALGHQSPVVTEIYAKRDSRLAEEVVRKIG
jgi:integrase